jgi:hypothetical protein
MIYPIVGLTANRQNLSTTFKTLIAVFVTSGALMRLAVTEFSLGAADVPNATDCNIEFDLARMTADGTGTTYAQPFLKPLETGTQVAPRATMKHGYSSEPTVTASSSVESQSMNQRGTYRWAALDRDAEPEAPAIANNGLVLRALSPNYAAKMASSLKFRE